MTTSRRCHKCEGRMTEGFMIDQGYGTVHVEAWQPGRPRKSFWFGVRQVKADQKEVTTFRCDRCGYLESFAV